MHIDINTRRVETEACSGTWSLVCGGAYKSLARPTSRCRRTESIVSLERGVCSCCRIASHLLLQGMKWSTSGDAREFNNIKTRAVIEFFFPARQGAEGDSHHSDRNMQKLFYGSGTEESGGKSWSSWPVGRNFGYTSTTKGSSSAVQYMNLTGSNDCYRLYSVG